MSTRPRSRTRRRRCGRNSAAGAPSPNGIPPSSRARNSKEGDAEYRTLTLQDGGKIKEKLLDKSGASYRYEIVESPLPVKNYEAQFTVTPDDDDLDEVNIVWAATYDAADGKEDAEARKTIDGIFKDGIDSIKGKLGDKVVDKKRRRRTTTEPRFLQLADAGRERGDGVGGQQQGWRRA